MITAAHCTDMFENNKTEEKLCVKETAAGKTYRKVSISLNIKNQAHKIPVSVYVC
jgi:hypothetical protein